MRVFYPVSARLSDLLNDETTSQPGWMVLWSATSIALLLLVVSALPQLGGIPTGQPQEAVSKHRPDHARHVRCDRHSRQHIFTATAGSGISAQSYVDAHRCALSYSCVLPANLPRVAPGEPPAGAGLYL